MRLSRVRTTGAVAFAGAVVIGAFVTGTGTSTQAAEKATKPKAQHYARVRADGMFVDGTAISSERFSEGTYRVRFPARIGGCAASANSASFPGFDLSVFRATAQISIGFGEGGAFDDETVTVSFFSTSDDSSVDTAFTLILVCP